jgi:biofilm PGA synthesis N-glycosyltransferase PgaC
MRSLRYAVITPARDEAENLPRLAEALHAQTVLPSLWIVVENGSTDATLEVANRLATESSWIRVLSMAGDGRPVRGAPIVRSIEAALELLGEEHDVIVNVDADISMGSDFFARLLDRFAADPTLGIASGTCYELRNGEWQERHVTGNTAWGATRAYRRECLQQVLPLEGRLGWDGIDELKANARGWRTTTFTDLPFFHHRSEGERDGMAFKARVTQGRSAHYMGYRFWYLLLRSAGNTPRDPAAVGMVWGFLGAALHREPRLADTDARAYIRRQQSLRNLPVRIREARGRRS